MTDTTKTEALADEYARLAARARVESLYGTSKSYTAECQKDENEARAELIRAISAVEAERDRLAAECEALRADAERYRWLRSSEDTTLEDLQWQLVRDYGDEYLDAKIDAAMGGKESQGGNGSGQQKGAKP